MPGYAAARAAEGFTHFDRQRLERALEYYLRDCFRNATRVTVAEFATCLGCHPDYLTRIAASILGAMSLLDFLRSKQLEEAERLLDVTDLSIKEIALRSGFGTISSFYRRFQAAHQMSPGTFRKVRK